MKRQKASSLAMILLLCSFASVAVTELYAASPQEDQLHTYLKQGIEKAFNLETRGAIASLQKAVDLDRENPTGYAFLALAHMLFHEMSFAPQDRERNQEAMLRYIRETQGRGAKRIEGNPKDAKAYFAMSVAKIVKVRWAISQKSYVVLTQETSNLWGYFEKAREGDPQNYDIYFLMGMLHYHLDHLPGLARFFSSILITPGNRLKGLEELELAVQKGDLLRELAQSELASVYANFEKQPARAIPILRELKNKFPQNYFFAFALANGLSDLNRPEEALVIAREIENGLRAGTPPYVPQLQSRYDQLMGRILFNQREYDRATEYLQKALKDKAPYNARVRAWVLVRLGMIQDARKDRKLALDYYTMALEVEGGEGAAQVDAKRYLKTPYSPPPKP